MLDIREVEYWISRYENEASKMADCVVLSSLYSIRDRLGGGETPEPRITAYSAAPPPQEPSGPHGSSDFLQAVSGKDSAAAWAVMNELMETLQAVKPRVYASVMRKLQAL